MLTNKSRHACACIFVARTAIVVQVEVPAGLSLHLYVGQLVEEVLQPEKARWLFPLRKLRVDVPGVAVALHTRHSARPPADCRPCPPKACASAWRSSASSSYAQQVRGRAQGRNALVLPVRVGCPPAVQASALSLWRARVGPGLVYDVRDGVQLVHWRVEGQSARGGRTQH